MTRLALGRRGKSNPMTKLCRHCKVEKDATEFNARKTGSRDGLMSWCRACHIQRSREHFAADKNRQRALIRRWSRTPRGRAASIASTLRWQAKNRVKVRAQDKVKYEIRCGRMVRKPCEVCGDIRSHAHHEDYSKPLDVNWLCPKHHADRHAQLRKAAA